MKIRSSWLNCALRGDGAVYWVSIGQQWLQLVALSQKGGTGQFLMALGQFSIGLLCLYILKKWRFDRVTLIPKKQTRKDKATQASEK